MMKKCYIYYTDSILMSYILELLTCISNIVTAVETNVCDGNDFWFIYDAYFYLRDLHTFNIYMFQQHSNNS